MRKSTTFYRKFLCTKTFKGRIDSILPDSFSQDEGVPQGSVLSVVLFIIKINDIIKNLPPSIHSSLFVDDFHIHYSNEDYLQVIINSNNLQVIINRINEWWNVNGFKIPPQKSVGVHFCRIRGLQPDPKLKLNNQAISFATEVQILDSYSTINLHSNHTLAPSKENAHFHLTLIKYYPIHVIGQKAPLSPKIYRALIRPKLDYGSSVYGSAAKSNPKDLETIHYQGLRLSVGAFRTSSRSFPTPKRSLHVMCNEPFLELRRERLTLNLFFKIKRADSHLLNYSVINPIYSSLFSIRLSYKLTFIFRIGELKLKYQFAQFILQ